MIQPVKQIVQLVSEASPWFKALPRPESARQLDRRGASKQPRQGSVQMATCQHRTPQPSSASPAASGARRNR
ncbi:hypothetical protein TSOC_009149 [Tetrabaena socialis]|uniref:Uncharacterized protein n=1 Tax=Tetrabaena socialis TaxID=47790 RepID=A0A2J7ZWM2_9CHLO|nr:hypothetical protein TSOC_009149 [Tetrabaena socialis]|eukprot:PNH04658.1 hypothetical protein TSOC_009149 [Tetrabaena socialis]